MQSEQMLGQTIRRLREQGGLSLKILADKAEVSESFVSQVERGVANPRRFASLRRIAEALGISIAALFHGVDGVGRVVRSNERQRMVHPARRWEDSLLTPGGSRRLQVIHSVIEPGGSGEEAYSHDSDEECVIVLKGSLEFGVGVDTYLLEEGDSITFESRLPHWNRNASKTKTEVLWIITPPSY